MKPESDIQWELLTEVYQPDEAQLIGGLLNMAGIPVKIDREAIGEIYGLTVGPLAKIMIRVPGERRAEAEQLLNQSVTGDGDDLPEQ